MSEFEHKIHTIRQLLNSRALDGIILERVPSMAWATCGATTYVGTASTFGIATLLVTRHDLHLITNNIEAPRLEGEEKLKNQGWAFHVSPWYAGEDVLGSLSRGMKLGADTARASALDLSGEISRLRAELTPEEGERFRSLGYDCAEAMNAAIRRVQPGQTEFEIAAILGEETQRRGVQPIVNLIATDGRIFAYRHPLPTGKALENYAMLVLCGRRAGLVCSITRLVYFGRLPDELRRKSAACAAVDAAMIQATRPGQAIADIFQTTIRAYAQAGYPGEWQLHHQGGPAGYEPREFVATPSSTEVVSTGQVFAWNPSITGVKSEDTILIGEQGNEILTEIGGWPLMEVSVQGQSMLRPAILEIV